MVDFESNHMNWWDLFMDPESLIISTLMDLEK